MSEGYQPPSDMGSFVDVRCLAAVRTRAVGLFALTNLGPGMYRCDILDEKCYEQVTWHHEEENAAIHEIMAADVVTRPSQKKSILAFLSSYRGMLPDRHTFLKFSIIKRRLDTTNDSLATLELLLISSVLTQYQNHQIAESCKARGRRSFPA